MHVYGMKEKPTCLLFIQCVRPGGTLLGGIYQTFMRVLVYHKNATFRGKYMQSNGNLSGRKAV